MDRSAAYRALVRKYLPYARIVAGRFHVIPPINHHSVACWRDLDPVGAKCRGLLSLMRRHRHNLKPEHQLKLQAYFAQHHPVLAFALPLLTAALLSAAEKAQTRKQWQN